MIPITKSTIMTGAACIATALVAQAAVIAQYTFTGSSPASTAPVNANVTVSNFGNGTGLVGGTPAYAAVSSSGMYFARSSGTGVTDLAGAITDGDYVTFTVDVAAGYKMDLTSLTARQGYSYNSTFTGKWLAADLLTSASGFTSADSVYHNQKDVTTPQSGSAVYYDDWNVDLSGAAFQGLTGSTEFRFYLTDNTNDANIIHRLDDVELNGVVSAIPEPATTGVLGLGAVLCLFVRRRLV